MNDGRRDGRHGRESTTGEVVWIKSMLTYHGDTSSMSGERGGKWRSDSDEVSRSANEMSPLSWKRIGAEGVTEMGPRRGAQRTQMSYEPKNIAIGFSHFGENSDEHTIAGDVPAHPMYLIRVLGPKSDTQAIQGGKEYTIWEGTPSQGPAAVEQDVEEGEFTVGLQGLGWEGIGEDRQSFAVSPDLEDLINVSHVPRLTKYLTLLVECKPHLAFGWVLLDVEPAVWSTNRNSDDIPFGNAGARNAFFLQVSWNRGKRPRIWTPKATRLGMQAKMGRIGVYRVGSVRSADSDHTFSGTGHRACGCRVSSEKGSYFEKDEVEKAIIMTSARHERRKDKKPELQKHKIPAETIDGKKAGHVWVTSIRQGDRCDFISEWKDVSREDKEALGYL
ncbi:hypothetical protein DFH09DRAFT_1098815 [Mycena vulgaris]|nr:hypothetical protein DFH09DRAFT_1098815 [Mycena vulgaris]